MNFQSLLRLLPVAVFLSCGTSSVHAVEDRPLAKAEASTDEKTPPVWILSVNPSASVDSDFTQELFKLLEVPKELVQKLRGIRFSLIGFEGDNKWQVSIRNLEDADELLKVIQDDGFYAEVRNGSELRLSRQPLAQELEIEFNDDALFSFELDLHSINREDLESEVIKRLERVQLAMYEEAASEGMRIQLVAGSMSELPDGEKVESTFRKLGEKLGKETGLPLQNLTLEVSGKTIRFTAALGKDGRQQFFSLVTAIFSSAMEKAEEPSE